jgi:hypothetical protein
MISVKSATYKPRVKYAMASRIDPKVMGSVVPTGSVRPALINGTVVKVKPKMTAAIR